MTTLNPPYSNRGVVIKQSEENPLVSMVDYVRVSFKTHDIDYILENVMHLKKDYMQELESGFYGYIGTFQLDNIKVFYSALGDNRGILVEMSGKGCRQFESFLNWRKQTWFDFFADCLEHKGTFTRFDLAIDDYKTYFDIPMILEKVRNGEAVSKFRKSDYNGSYAIDDGEAGGTTIYFGSKKSEVYLCFYQKNYEQAEKYNQSLEDYPDWNRYELRLKNDRANIAVKELIERQDLLKVAKEIINNYLRFVEKRDTNRNTWKTCAFWEKFIGDVSKLSLYMEPKRDFYERSRNWLKNSCSPTMKMVLEADETLGKNDLSDMIMGAELSDKQEKMLNVFLADIGDMVY